MAAHGRSGLYRCRGGPHARRRHRDIPGVARILVEESVVPDSAAADDGTTDRAVVSPERLWRAGRGGTSAVIAPPRLAPHHISGGAGREPIRRQLCGRTGHAARAE